MERVSSVDAAEAVVARVRNQMPTATHHAFAYRIDASGALSVRATPPSCLITGMGACSRCDVSAKQHCSDDREVKGTAGPPIQARLDGDCLVQTVVVVTRCYGGTKLGRGGLVRSYGAAATAGLAAAGSEEVRAVASLLACSSLTRCTDRDVHDLSSAVLPSERWPCEGRSAAPQWNSSERGLC